MGLKEKVNSLPSRPGVYIMKDRSGKVVYVGKASNLKKRVASYFKTSGISRRHEALVEKIHDISYISTQNEAEALIYEASLIKSFKPKYNIELKDDKSYPLLKLTLNEDFPRLLITRKINADGSKYYGPYTNVKLLRQALRLIKMFFPLRVCRTLPKRACLNYHMGQCPGPCLDKIKKDEYMTTVEDVMLFLDGKKDALVKTLSARMKKMSSEMDFEGAAKLRDQIIALSAVPIRHAKLTPESALTELKDALSLRYIPYRIEAFDISNVMGKESVGSMVSFLKGRADKDNYRRFKIKNVRGIDDYQMIKEIVGRRYERLLKENFKSPDLIIIDGGPGHLGSAKSELDRLKLKIPIMSIAKEHEYIYTSNKNIPIILPKNSKSLQLIQRIRDEAHRFAISYHRLRRAKYSLTSELDKIDGIGALRKRALLRYFGSLDSIRKASKENLLKVKGLNEKQSEKIIAHFKG